jgi:hypothetical protein
LTLGQGRRKRGKEEEGTEGGKRGGREISERDLVAYNHHDTSPQFSHPPVTLPSCLHTYRSSNVLGFTPLTEVTLLVFRRMATGGASPAKVFALLFLKSITSCEVMVEVMV